MNALLFTLSGPIVWALHFFAVYGTQTLLNVTAGSDARLRVLVALYTLVATMLIGTGLLKIQRSQMPNADMAEFMPKLTQGLAAISGLAIAWTFLSAMLAE
jgi:hypothetical protein